MFEIVDLIDKVGDKIALQDAIIDYIHTKLSQSRHYSESTIEKINKFINEGDFKVRLIYVGRIIKGRVAEKNITQVLVYIFVWQ